MGGTILIILGSIFLINSVFGWGLFWPLMVAFPGFITLAVYFFNPKENDAALIPSGILLTIAGLFLLTNLGVFAWSDMAWLWPVFIMAPGVGLLFYYFASRDSDVLTPVVVLLSIAGMFMIAMRFADFWTYAPILLIILGVIIVLTSRGKKGWAQRLQEKMERFGERMEAWGKRVEKRFEKFEDKFEKKQKKK